MYIGNQGYDARLASRTGTIFLTFFRTAQNGCGGRDTYDREGAENNNYPISVTFSVPSPVTLVFHSMSASCLPTKRKKAPVLQA